VNTDSGRREFPTPTEAPPLMAELGAWHRSAPATAKTAFEPHRRLVGIHPFNDANGRTAPLLMNLILILGGFPPVAVRPEDRLAYLRAIEKEQAGQDDEDFRRLLYERLDATLGEYLSALQKALPQAGAGSPGKPNE
jgi:Fic family protein